MSADADWRQIQERLALIGDDDDDDEDEGEGGDIVVGADRDEESFQAVSKKEKKVAINKVPIKAPAPVATWISMRHTTPSQRRACLRITALAVCIIGLLAAIVAAMLPRKHA